MLLASLSRSADLISTASVALLLLLAFAIPALGYVFMVVDYRAYLRSLRRVMVVAGQYALDLPGWVRQRQTPPALAALGLVLPCTEEDVLKAYRHRVKELHPDRGGDRKRFLRLQAQFEEAMRVVRQSGSDAG